jgi:hypothetical protein
MHLLYATMSAELECIVLLSLDQTGHGAVYLEVGDEVEEAEVLTETKCHCDELATSCHVHCVDQYQA